MVSAADASNTSSSIASYSTEGLSGEIVDTNAPITAGDTLEVEVRYSYSGLGTTQINPLVKKPNGETFDNTKGVTMNVGYPSIFDQDRTFRWDTDSGDAGSHSITLGAAPLDTTKEIASNLDTEQVEIREANPDPEPDPGSDPNYKIESIESNGPITTDEELSVSAKVTNDGGSGEETFYLTAMSDERGRHIAIDEFDLAETVSLNTGETETIKFNWDHGDVNDYMPDRYTTAGTVEFGIYTVGGESKETEVEVKEPEPDFTTTSIESNGPITTDEELSVSAEVTNDGGSGEQKFHLTYLDEEDGHVPLDKNDDSLTQTVSLNKGESETVTFNWEYGDVSDHMPDTYTTAGTKEFGVMKEGDQSSVKRIGVNINEASVGPSVGLTDADSWSSSGPGTHDVSTGDTGIKFTYDSNDYLRHTWEYETTAQSDAYLEVDWNYEGHHSWFWADADAYIEVNGDRTKLTDTGGSGAFSASGTTEISVNKGDTVRVVLEGFHYDWSRTMRGTFSITDVSRVEPEPIEHAITEHATDSWGSSGPGTHDVSTGDTGIKFTYDSNDYSSQWEYETTAQSDTDLEVDWNYEGHHSWYYAAADAYIEVNGDRTKLTDKETHGSFSASGKTRISVSKGDTVRVILQGRHYDWSKIMRGTFTASFSE